MLRVDVDSIELTPVKSIAVGKGDKGEDDELAFTLLGDGGAVVALFRSDMAMSVKLWTKAIATASVNCAPIG